MQAKIEGQDRTFNLTPAPNKRLPKRFAYKVNVVVNGENQEAPVTTNKGWNSDAGTVLEYPFIQVGEKVYYLTTSYGVTAKEIFEGKTIETSEGTAERKDPTRYTDKPITEAERIAKFKETYRANR